MFSTIDMFQLFHLHPLSVTKIILIWEISTISFSTIDKENIKHSEGGSECTIALIIFGNEYKYGGIGINICPT